MGSLGLLGKFRLWLRRRRLVKAGYLFRYFDGLTYRYADPLAIYRALIDHPAGILELTAALEQGKEPETSQLLAAVAEVFGLTRFDPWTGVGLLDQKIFDLLSPAAAWIGARLGLPLVFLGQFGPFAHEQSLMAGGQKGRLVPWGREKVTKSDGENKMLCQIRG
ncbi:MAG: hypothetical protein NZ899_15235 [Thermoguttaceae bacterium]|nr:hypothetical protein [Thermoguttaceae bacterium]